MNSRSMARALLILGSALAASALRVEQHGRAMDPACECLDFATVYGSGKAQCGMGLELVRLASRPDITIPGPAAKFMIMCLPGIKRAKSLPALWKALNRKGVCHWQQVAKMDTEDCRDFPGYPNSSFYLHQRHSYCIKASNYADSSSFLHGASWCYVSSRCQDLHGGARINDAVSFKPCWEDQDKFLGALSVPDLCKLQDSLNPAGRLIGGCQAAALKAYPMGSGSLPSQPVGPKEPTRFWGDMKKDAVVVQQHGRRYEIYGDLRDGSDYKCVSGCTL
eukprot:CAMPEP_0171193606 /NCGR_PEP_ID=MMETSP0790-20130122/20466_1 /TAXON_ID=2925 /ORGANISM="Alexandrium catenella, Strain OF101" /LENGTH=277 /DNA_ID=CAMNT_0011658789 /DNA_START=49 /DNA_END=882 /DNA_ORIENTATION=-